MRPYHFFPPSDPASNAVVRRRPRCFAARIVAGVVAGSGALNLLSLLGGPVPGAQPEWLRGLFPLDFVGLSRTATLILGFGLILAAIHLWGNKRRAWRLSLVLAAASAAFHLTKGWDVEEAVCSAAIVAALWLARREFRMGAGRPALWTAAARAAAAFLIAGFYGAAGFWFLQPHEFRHNFHWWEAAFRTIRLMLFLGDDSLAPHTAYAAWFLDSLFWISAAAFLYAGFVLFRPVAYRFRFDPVQSAAAGNIAARYGSGAIDFFKHLPDKSYFFSSTGQSFLGYRVAGNYALALGDPVGPQDEARTVIEEFLAFCHARGWHAGFHQVGPRNLPLYESMGLRMFLVGEDAIVDLTRFSLSGSENKEFRNTVNRLDRLGYHVQRFDPPLTPPLVAALKSVSDSWLEIPGHRERQFTLGRFEPRYLRATPVYVAFDANRKPVAFLNLVPSYQPQLATVDLMRRGPDTVNGIMDYLFINVFLDLNNRNFERFSLGMAPLSGTPSRRAERIVRWAMTRMPFFFRTASLRRFKSKYAGHWVPRYSVYEGPFDLPRLALALHVVSEAPQRENVA